MPEAIAGLRAHAVAFAAEHGAGEETRQSVALAVSEMLTNVVVHAYAGGEPGPMTLVCRNESGRLVFAVSDEGVGITAREDSPGVGFGLSMVGALVDSLDVAARQDGPGTVVTMSLGSPVQPPELPGLEPLCGLALERIADVSCVDLVSGGVLRRAAAEVAGDPDLTDWLQGAMPPAKPGTATWAAMREGGPHLVEHDPSVPRSPGGTGERLDLMWWVSVPLEGADGAPAALWGLGGRAGGRPVPSGAVIDALGAAADVDLTQEPERAALRTRLGQIFGV